MSSLASSLFTLVGVAARRPAGLRGDATIPLIVKERVIDVDAGWLRDFRRCVGAVDDGVLPPTAPQVLAVPLHTAILGDARFPLPALGMVHVDNRIEERAAIPANARLHVRASVEGHKPHERGVTFDIITTVHVEGALVWSSTMTALVRDKAKADTAKANKSRAEAAPTTPLSSSMVRAWADQGRRYARVSGDANPIHLTALTAKAFGFPRAIAHGMWTLARTLSEVDDQLPQRPRRIEVRFVRPVLLPSTMVVEARSAGSGVSLVVGPQSGGVPHVVGTVTPTVSA